MNNQQHHVSNNVCTYNQKPSQAIKTKLIKSKSLWRRGKELFEIMSHLLGILISFADGFRSDFKSSNIFSLQSLGILKLASIENAHTIPPRSLLEVNEMMTKRQRQNKKN